MLLLLIIIIIIMLIHSCYITVYCYARIRHVGSVTPRVGWAWRFDSSRTHHSNILVTSDPRLRRPAATRLRFPASGVYSYAMIGMWVR